MTDLLDMAAADLGAVFFTDFIEPATVGGTSIDVIVEDGAGDDHRAPLLRAVESDLPSAAPGDAVVVRGVTYQLEFARRIAPGVVQLGLRLP